MKETISFVEEIAVFITICSLFLKNYCLKRKANGELGFDFKNIIFICSKYITRTRSCCWS